MKRVLNASALESAGIEFSEQVVTLEELKRESPQARILAQYLIDFKHVISHERWEELDHQDKDHLSATERDHIVIPEKLPKEKSHPYRYQGFIDRYDIRRCEANFDLASRIKKKADDIRSKDEDRWTEVIKDCVFERLREQARKEEGATYNRRAVNALKRFRVESDHIWYFGREVLKEYCQQTHFELTAPKPDLYLSFHAYLQGDAECGPLSADDYIENFSVTRLSQLYEEYPELARKLARRDRIPQFGFTSSPCKKFYDVGSFKDRACFPWAVCEWKHHGKIGTCVEDFLYCQAANAAAVCLTLFANAAAGGRSTPVLDDIRPVVCMTFTGPKSKVWVAYVTEVEAGRRYKYRMRCIWEGDLRVVLDNVKLCVIIENLHFWAMNYLRPWLSSCVDQWRRSIAEMEDVESESAESDSSLNYSLRRAATLDDFLNQEDEDDVDSDIDEDDADYDNDEDYVDGDDDGDDGDDDGDDSDNGDDDDDEQDHDEKKVCEVCGSVY
ncbi:hypothetical protein K458DRAFT_415905 [Lentithecium fluviatile CBS 122367]|uniref:Uncharacterized protein n=1 Tax=Lentithecium fluviatile CBS 122367 TaxID=1168545 RepID=A0A6G1J7P4_9PLEO|nr:hypothetical protein K458DRAFT_415905 [Lentithecium fluviatile CBS 122367]